ncbi:hypothetical protein BGZ76_000458 [Entomortierella beljakovae]|nr:hypothetical protein BGZ76_000458 [Entomortierella beljakovae]
MLPDQSIIAKERLQNIVQTIGTPPSKALNNSTGRANRLELNPLHFLPRTAAIYPTKIAVVYEDRQYTYLELNRRSLGLAYALKDTFGIGNGDRVAVIASNIPAMLEANFGIPAAGGIICSINTRLSPLEVAYILDHSGSKVILCDVTFKSLVKDSKLPIIFIEDTGLLINDPYERFITTGFTKADSLEWSGLTPNSDEENTLSLCYTSGTTGKPKGVQSTYRSIYLAALGQAVESQLSLETSFLFIVPYFHAISWCFPFAVASTGGKFVLLKTVDYDVIWKLILKENVTNLNGAPTIMIQITHHPLATRLSRSLNCTVGGSAPSATLIASMKKLNMNIQHCYGLTETVSTVTNCYHQPSWDNLEIDELAQYNARQGHVHLVAGEVRVVDPKMNDVVSDGKQIGEIVVRGNSIMKGYHNDPKATENAFRGGFFHTGDLAVRYPDGYISIQDREKDIIISGGENISTIEVESCIYQHPSVFEVAVVGAPSDKWGETPKAFVTLKPDLPSENIVNGEAIVAFCKERIGRFKCPSFVEIVQELPKNGNGKIKKYLLREREWKGYTKRIN